MLKLSFCIPLCGLDILCSPCWPALPPGQEMLSLGCSTGSARNVTVFTEKAVTFQQGTRRCKVGHSGETFRSNDRSVRALVWEYALDTEVKPRDQFGWYWRNKDISGRRQPRSWGPEGTSSWEVQVKMLHLDSEGVERPFGTIVTCFVLFCLRQDLPM